MRKLFQEGKKYQKTKNRTKSAAGKNFIINDIFFRKEYLP